MGSRRRGREGALQILYQLEAGIDPGPPEMVGEDTIQRGPLLAEVNVTLAREALELFRENFDANDKAWKFTEKIVVGVASDVEALNALVQKHSPNWRLDRMAMVDRNVLRIASWELRADPEVPTKVIVDEAIEIARRFGSERSAAFVNGVIDAVATEVRDDDAQAFPAPPGND